MKLFLVFFIFPIVEISSECSYQKRALLAAILPLHDGPFCNQTTQRGAQQMAALSAARESVNRVEYSMQIEIKFFDSCSSTKSVVTAALKALLLSNFDCRNPFFLGVLGPEDHESVRAVSKVMSIFPTPFIVSALTPSSSGLLSALNVDLILPAHRAQKIWLILDELNWSSFYFAVTDDPLSAEIANAFLELKKFCVLQSVVRISISNDLLHPDSLSHNRLLWAIQQAKKPAKLLLIANSPSAVEKLLIHLTDVIEQLHILIYVNEIDFLPWKLPKKLGKHVLILQQTSSSILEENLKLHLENTSYYKAESELDMPLDYTVGSLTKLVYLLRQGLENGLARCNNKMCSQVANDWKNILEGSAVQIKDSLGLWQKVSFRSIEENSLVIYKSNESYTFEEIGKFLEDNKLHLRQEVDHFRDNKTHLESCENFMTLLEDSLSTSSTTMKIPLDLSADIFGISLHLENLGFYEQVASIIGIIIAIVLTFLACVFFVFKCFQVPVTKAGSSKSSSSEKV